ncbi:hypothetical protein Metli_2222 [Methanofollis liminatans DSM 4140]|uniref:Uncharacterized protein n=1 Tax=Methanofollis liminatans DSM 4140 TaxID=28892 RepID=J1ASW3_9EURY|nr:hypothetical protein [Methanofollis liminatans]EJG08163.1 hypothetical protein Metli_2222 [Methanofollis liminatans DSM 4140]
MKPPTADLSSLLARYEGRRIDFKEEVSSTFYKLLSAFANTAGVSATTALKELKALAEFGILERRSPSKKKTHYVLAQGPVPDV